MNEGCRMKLVDQLLLIFKDSQIIPNTNLRNSHAGCDAQDILELPLSGK
jgi:hypothetical protein